MINILERVGTEEIYSAIIKTIYEKNHSQHYPKWIKTQSNPIKISNMSGLPNILFNVILEALPGTVKQKNKIKGKQKG